MLPDGHVLAIGGSSNIGGLTASRGVLPAELWSPATKTWKTLASMQTPRMYHSTSLLLPDGRVLVAGGGRLYVAEDFLNAEGYSPAYLFKGPRPSVTAAPASLHYGSSFFGFTPGVQNRVGSTSSTSFTDNGLPSGTYYYAVAAVDAAGNVGPSSNEASAVVTADAVPPTVSLTAPAPAATVGGSVNLTADAA